MNYKLSNYNYFVEFKGRIILHNLLTGSLFSIKKDLFHEIEPFLRIIDFLRINNQPVFNLLNKTGFIVDYDFDEIDFLRLLYIREMSINPFYKLIINPTLECNFSCWYCYQNHPTGFMGQEVQEKVKMLCENLVTSNQVSGINLGWFGGEPLMYFNEVIYPLSNYIKQIVNNNNLEFYNSITTNGYLISQDFIDKFCEIDLSEFQITLDGDEERHNKIRNHSGSPSYAKIVKNINSLVQKNNNVKVCLRINYEDDTFNGLDSIFESFADVKSNVYIDLQRVWQTYEEAGSPIGSSALDFSRKCLDKGFKLMNSYLDIRRGTPCYADRMNFAHVNFDGKVYKCTARNYEDSNELGFIDSEGFIKWHPKKLMPPHRKFSFDNEQCLKCKYLPICLGPCYQKRFERISESGYCFAQGYEQFIEDYIVLKYRQKFNL